MDQLRDKRDWAGNPPALLRLSFPSIGGMPSGGAGGVGGGIGHDIQQVMHAYRVDEQFADIAGSQYRTLDACLTARGYHQFRLTAEQDAQLRHLRRGSDERRLYLHSLGSDPEALSRQAP